MIKCISHAAFIVNDMKAALNFYENGLGMKKIHEQSKEDGTPWFVYLQVGETQFLELFYADAPFEPAPMWKKSHYGHLCIEVDDIQDIASRLRAAGIKMEIEPKQGLDLNWQAWVCDPDGNALEFMQIMPGSPQAKVMGK